jgi:ABC-type nitrate/sulfonate/bicarbonate transport system permease component
MMKWRFWKYSALFVSIGLFLFLWWLISSIVNDPFLLAGPGSTMNEFTRLFTEPVLSSQLTAGIETTLVAIFLGFGLSVIVGVPLGILMGRYLVADLFLDPWVNSWYSIPAIAFVPLTMNLTGVTWVSAMLTSFLVAVFSITINVYSGVKNCSRPLVDPALSYGATGSQVMLKVILPASLPSTMTGLRLGISRAVEGVIIAEMVFTVVGLGGMIDASADKLQLALSYSLIFVLAVICIGLSLGMKFLTRKIVSWKESEAISRN